jgi:uncharacterized protein
LEDRAAKKPIEDPPSAVDKRLQRNLLRLARTAIEEAVGGGKGASVDLDDDALQQPASVFVTLWREQEEVGEGEGELQLRGCIGRLQADLPLYQAVRTAAVGAAIRDPRFPAVCADELDRLVIEVAILSEPMLVESLEEVKIGRDGLIIEYAGRRGLLLPKVATRLNWDRGAFVRGVCSKAGLPEDTWPERGKLSRFQTFVFQE